MSQSKRHVLALAAMLCIGALGAAIALMLTLGGMSAAVQLLDRVMARIFG